MTCLAVITSLVLMRAWSLEVPSSSSDVWKEWELRGVVFLSLALQIVLICLGSCRKYFPYTWIKVVTWSAYLLADSVAIYAIGMISNMIREIKAGKSLSNPHTELSTFWAPFLLLHLGGPDTISAYAIEDNELWLRHLLTLVNQAGLTVYVLVMAWTHPILSFLAILILLSGFYKYGERVWVLRTASHEQFKDSFTKSRPRRKDSGKIEAESDLKREEGYNVASHHVIDVDNEDAIMIDVAIAKFHSKKVSSVKESEDQGYERIAGTLLLASRLVHTSQRLFADHLFSMEECDSCLSILRGKHCAGDFKVIEIELGLIYDMFYSKAKVVYTKWGFICRLAISFSICVALVLFSFTDKRPYSKPDLFLTFLLLGAAIFIELYALAHILFSDQVACWLIERKQSAVFHFINRLAHVLFSHQVTCWLNEKKQSSVFYFITRIRPLLKRHRWSNSMGQYNLMSYQKNYFRWWSFLKLSHVEEMAVKFLYPRHVPVSDDVKKLIMSKIKEMEARVQEMDEKELQDFQMRDRGFHALGKHKLLNDEYLIRSIEELDFDMSILVWHIATELCYYLDYGWPDSTKELERNNQSPVKEKSLMGLHLSRYMIYLQYMRPSMLPARFGSIRFRDIYKEPRKRLPLPKFTLDRPTRGRYRRERKPEISEKPGIAKDRDEWLVKLEDFYQRESEEDQVGHVLCWGYMVAKELQGVPRGWRWSAINEVWVEMLMYGANKCKARDHAQHMQGGGGARRAHNPCLASHVWLLMSHYGLTDNFQKLRDFPAATAEIIVNPW